jgi:hypothetical protein
MPIDSSDDELDSDQQSLPEELEKELDALEDEPSRTLLDPRSSLLPADESGYLIRSSALDHLLSSSTSSSSFLAQAPPLSEPVVLKSKNKKDEVVDPTRPSWQLPPKSRSHFQIMRALIRLDSEGLGALWKGFGTLLMLMPMDPWLQLQLESGFAAKYPSVDLSLHIQDVEHVGPHLTLLVGISALKGWLLSPLETIYTR